MSENIEISGEEILRKQAVKLTERIGDPQLRREAYNKTLKQLKLLYKNNINRGFDEPLAAKQAIDQFSRLVSSAVRGRRDSEYDVKVKETVKEQAAQTLKPPTYNPVPKQAVRTSPKPEAATEAPVQRTVADKSANNKNKRGQKQKGTAFFSSPAFISQLVIYGVFLIIAPLAAGLLADRSTASMINEMLFYFVGPALSASCGAVITLYCGLDIKSMLTMPVLFIANLLLYHGGHGWLWLLLYLACLAAGTVIGVGIRMILSTREKAQTK